VKDGKRINLNCNKFVEAIETAKEKLKPSKQQ